ncbi:MAG: lytic murein transglycosylase [Mangrovicoccus sp.]|nr:lytic murein transglycosylase [Mangrovicoccus sp.]
MGLQPLPASESLLQAAAWPRPMPRPDLSARVPLAVSNLGFQRWIQEFWPRAQSQGVRAQTFNAGFAGVQYNADVISNDRNQSEFSKQIWEYLDGAVSAGRIKTGQAMLRKYPTLLNRIEQRYGVEKEVVVAIWGLESSYGGYRGNTPTIGALATLAYDGRRGAFFESELVQALKILQAGDVSPRGMRGSWAGAMGHTQFMPSSFLKYAVDITGDGRRDIWSDDPSDALASTANYLARHGWKKGKPWAVEVRLPKGFDFAQSGPETQKNVAAWHRMGVRLVSGQPVPKYGRGAILLPAGARGPAFMIFANFEAIKAYNSSTAYVMAVGHLSDRLAGRPAIQASWPRGDRALRSSEKRELQERLTAAGFSTNGIDGKVGPDTIKAIKRWQSARGLLPDGYANTALLQRLRGG